VGFVGLNELMDVFEGLRREETKETMKRLLNHPSTTFVNRAADVLNQLGVESTRVPSAPPVRFRIYLNGEPRRSAEVSYDIVDAKGSYLAGGSLKTDVDGFAAIPRDEFLDPSKRGMRLRFCQFPSSADPSFSNRRLDEPWVSYEIELPKVFDTTISVPFAACPLPIEIKYPAPPEKGNKPGTHIKLSKADQAMVNEGRYLLDFDERTGPPPAAFTLSTIAPGKYQLTIITPGSAKHVTPPFSVAPGMAPVHIELEKGSHVYARLVMPENARGAGSMALYRGDQDITAEFVSDSSEVTKPCFSSLPRGNFQFRVLSTAEYMKKEHISDWTTHAAMWDTDPRERVDCEGASVDFTIDHSSPALVDLGTIEIRPVAAMKDKASGTLFYGKEAPR
jgi:hypothetical protein